MSSACVYLIVFIGGWGCGREIEENAIVERVAGKQASYVGKDNRSRKLSCNTFDTNDEQ